MQDLNSDNPENPESSEPSTEPSPQPEKSPFIPNLGVEELKQTLAMVVGAQEAILANEHWRGKDLAHIAMLMNMLRRMEPQYRSQIEFSKIQAKEAKRRAIEEIKSAGGTFNVH